MQVLARGLQLAWPPLAYSIQDDDEARRVYSVDLHLVRRGARLRGERACGSNRAGSCGSSPRPTSSRPTRRSACWRRASPSMRLYLAMVVILGRTGRTEFSFPATIAAVVTNVALNLVLVPSHGIVGAGLALVGSYVVVLVLMYAFTQRLFPVPYEWRRLALVLLSAAALVAAGELLLPTSGADRPAQPRRALARLPAESSTSSASSTRRSAPAWPSSYARPRSPRAPRAFARRRLTPGPTRTSIPTSGPRSTRSRRATRTARGPDRPGHGRRCTRRPPRACPRRCRVAAPGGRGASRCPGPGLA